MVKSWVMKPCTASPCQLRSLYVVILIGFWPFILGVTDLKFYFIFIFFNSLKVDISYRRPINPSQEKTTRIENSWAFIGFFYVFRSNAPMLNGQSDMKRFVYFSTTPSFHWTEAPWIWLKALIWVQEGIQVNKYKQNL